MDSGRSKAGWTGVGRAALLRALLLLAALVPGGAAGCGPSDPACATDPSEPLVASVSARPHPDMAVAALVDLRAGRGARQVVVEHGATEAYGRTLAPQAIGEGAATIPVLGLDPASTQHLRVTVQACDGTTATSGDLVVTTAALPTDLPPFEVLADDGTADGYLLLTVVGAGAATDGSMVGMALVLDYAGRIHWIRRVEVPRGNLTRASDFQRQANGHLTLFLPGLDTFDEMDLAGNLVRRWTDPAASWGADGHEFRILPNGNALMLGHDEAVMDLSGTPLGGPPDAQVDLSTVDEIAPDGRVVDHLSLHPAVLPDEAIAYIRDERGGLEYAHANSFDFAEDGHLLVSMLLTSSVLKIDRATGEVLWRLGGARSDFRFVDDPLDGFRGLHSLQVLPGNRLLLFDNGLAGDRSGSRVVEYALDEAARTATMVWQYRHDPDIQCIAAGSVRRLPGGDTVVGWSPEGLVERVHPDGTVAWAGKGAYFYRAFPAETLFPAP